MNYAMNYHGLILDDAGAQPLYKRVAEGLRRSILNGELPDGTRLPPETELASKMGVSHLTLRKGLKILSEQGLLAQRQRCGTFVTSGKPVHRRIGLVINSLDANHDRYIQRLISILSKRFFQNPDSAGELILLPIDTPDPKVLLNRINQTECEGLLVALYHQEYQKMLCEPQFSHIDKVFIGNGLNIPEDHGCFVSRQAPGAIMAGVEYLRSRNHHRIAYISSGLEYESLMERNREFLKARKMFGLDESPEYYILDNATLEWYAMARREAARICRLPNPPSAIICPGITFAYGAWQGIMDAGLKIPEDISFLGFDGDLATNPEMSTIEQPLDDILDKAVTLLFNQFRQGKHLKQKIYEFPVRVCERGSCRELRII